MVTYIPSKGVLKAGTWLYIDYIFATMIGNLSNLQRFISLEEINSSRRLRNSFFYQKFLYFSVKNVIYTCTFLLRTFDIVRHIGTITFVCIVFRLCFFKHRGFLRETRTINTMRLAMYDHMMGHCLFYPWEYLGIY